ncbi:WD40-repeat-containing domain protein [Amanita muscaria]
MNGLRPPQPPAVLQTPGFAHYSLSWSPFHTTRLALASSANFGLVGNGRLHLVTAAQTSDGSHALKLDQHYESQDGLYDVAWSEVHENQLATASGDGSVRLWDIMLKDLPIRIWQEHSREVFSVDWSNLRKDVFASSSWDGTVKLWTPDRPRSILTLQTHHACVYQAVFSPHHPHILATCSTDGTVKIFDTREPSYVTGPNTNSFTHPLTAAAITVPASTGEVLSIDWNKYKSFVLASGGVDKIGKIWDCRMVHPGEVNKVGGACETQLLGHEYAIRKLQWSPHKADIIATASYDMTCRIWCTTPVPGRPQLMHIHDSHTEFVVGCGWSLYEEGVIASFPHQMNEASRSLAPVLDPPRSLHVDQDPEDILSSSLETFYGFQPITLASARTTFVYTTKDARITIDLRVPDTQAANWSLHASDIWISSVYLVDHLDELLFEKHIETSPLRVLELGAGTGLPGILIAKMFPGCAVTVSDYPDESLIQNLRDNVERNSVAHNCRVAPYAWGSDPSTAFDGSEGFDIVIAADTLWNPESHRIFIDTLCATLSKARSSRIHLVASLHTGRYTIQAFLDALIPHGFEIEGISEKRCSGHGEREWTVLRQHEDDTKRRRWVVWIKIKWSISLSNTS